MFSHISSRERRVVLGLLGFFLVGAAPYASATVIAITSDTTAQQTVVGTDSLSVSSGVTLSTSTSGSSPTIRWNGSTGTGPTVTNSGTIKNTFDNGSNSGRAIDANISGLISDISFTLTNMANQLISAANDVFRINRSVGNGTVTVNNNGTMQSTGSNGNTNGQAIDFNGNTSSTGTVTINNHGVMSAADADGIRPGNRATINNFGSIQGNTTGDTGNDGIDFQDPGKSGTINNFGSASSITGARHGITAKEAITIYNEGTIRGTAGSGLNIDTTANSPVMSVTNASTGRIIGNAVSGADGDAIDIDRLATISNSGTIRALGLSSSPNLNEAIAIGGGTVTNLLGGMIVSDQRAITVDDSNLGNAFGAATLYNEGTITGGNGEAVKVTSAFSNTVTNKGTINGSVALGAASDTFNFYTGSILNGAIDGGGGADTIHLLGTGMGSLGNTLNVETLSVEGGNWTLRGAQNYALDALILDGGELILDSGAGGPGFSVYASEVLGANISGDMITNIDGGNGFNVYYKRDLAANGYLGGRLYDLDGGGLLIPVPEPQSIPLLLSALGLLAFMRRRELRR